MTTSWTVAVARDRLSEVHLVHPTVPTPAPGEAVLRVDRVGLTANNVTYAVLGESMRYWNFFPGSAAGLDSRWGLVPLWGFAEVLSSTVDGLEEGQRYYGYLPPSGHLVVHPGRVDARGFREASPHRQDLPSPYNTYTLTTGDAAYDPTKEDLLILFRPLFYTSFMLADFLQDNAFHGASTLLVSSASSKTAYAAAFELQRFTERPRLVGLTSAGNVGFTAELGCYDEILSYDELDQLDRSAPVAYLDLSGSAATRAALRAQLGDSLVHDLAVGLTHQQANADQADAFFFAPVQMRKRTLDWGRDGLDQRFSEAWLRFSDAVRPWIDISVRHGAEGFRQTWLEVLDGRVPPRVGHIISV